MDKGRPLDMAFREWEDTLIASPDDAREAVRAAIIEYLRVRFDGDDLTPPARILIRHLAAELENDDES